jgi:hypothetical protein
MGHLNMKEVCLFEMPGQSVGEMPITRWRGIRLGTDQD